MGIFSDKFWLLESSVDLCIVEKNRGASTCTSANSQPGLKTVGIKQVSSVISEVYGSRLNANCNQSQTFPLQQKLMICTVLLMVRGGRVKEITLGKVGWIAHWETFIADLLVN